VNRFFEYTKSRATREKMSDRDSRYGRVHVVSLRVDARCFSKIPFYVTLASGTQHGRPGRFQHVRVADGRRRGGRYVGGRVVVHDHVLVARAARAIVPSRHVDATGRRAETAVRPRGALVHVQLARGPFERVRTRALVRPRAHAAVQTLLLARGWNESNARDVIM